MPGKHPRRGTVPPGRARRAPSLAGPPWAADWLLEKGASLSRGVRDPRFLLKVQAAMEEARLGMPEYLKSIHATNFRDYMLKNSSLETQC